MGEDEDTENTHTVGIVITVYNASGTEEKKIEAWVLGIRGEINPLLGNLQIN